MRPPAPIRLTDLMLLSGVAVTLDALLAALTLVSKHGASTHGGTASAWHIWAERAASATLDVPETTRLADALFAVSPPTTVLTVLARHTTNVHLPLILAEHLRRAGGEATPLLHLAVSPHLSPSRQVELMSYLLTYHRGLVKVRGGSLSLEHACEPVAEAVVSLAGLSAVLPRNLDHRCAAAPLSDVAARRLLSGFAHHGELAPVAVVLTHPSSGVSRSLRDRVASAAARLLKGGTTEEPVTVRLELAVQAAALTAADQMPLAELGERALSAWALLNSADEHVTATVLRHVVGRVGRSDGYAEILLGDLISPRGVHTPLSGDALLRHRDVINAILEASPTAALARWRTWPNSPGLRSVRASATAARFGPLAPFAEAVLLARARSGDVDAYTLLQRSGGGGLVDGDYAAATYPWQGLRATAPELLVAVAVSVHAAHGATGLDLLTRLEVGHAGTLNELHDAVFAALAPRAPAPSALAPSA